MEVLALESNRELLKHFKTHKDVWKYMLWCTETPRGSENTAEFINKMTEHAEKNLKLPVYKDDAGNLVIRKPATPGYEKAPVTCIQCHSDMVCTSDGVEWDPKKDPVTAKIDGEWLKADGTSLGSDNGIGIAAAFALLEDKNVKHPALEILITNDEEIGLVGAFEMKGGILKSTRLINVDSEKEYAICVGCAGGFNADIKLPIKRCTGCSICDAGKGTDVKMSISGLKGGHSGVDIDLQRASAIKWLAKVLVAIEDEGILVTNFKSGEAHNAIPRSGEVEIRVPADKFEAIKKKACDRNAELEKEVALIEVPENVKFTFEKIEKPAFAKPLDAESTMKLIHLLNTLPHGPSRMSPEIKGLVETSAIAAVISFEEEKVNILASGRSSRDSELVTCEKHMASISKLAGAEFKASGHYPGWSPDPKSEILNIVKDAYAKVIKEPEPDIYMIHAGLECGLFRIHYPYLDSVSIGPEIKYPHSPDEKILIASVGRFYDLLKKTLELSK